MGDVLSGKAAIGGCAEILERTRVVDFSSPAAYEFLTFITATPRPHFSWRAVYHPLQGEVWAFLGSCCVIIVTAFLLVLTIKFEKRPRHRKKVGFPATIRFVYSALLEQGDGTGIPSLTLSDVRLLASFWLLFVVIIQTGYKSKLTTSLAFPNLKIPPSTYESLAQAGYSIFAQKSGAISGIAKSTTNPTFVKLFNSVVFKGELECLKEVIHTQDSACISFSTLPEYLAQRYVSDSSGNLPFIKATSASAYFIRIGLITKKRTVWKSEMDKYLEQIMDSGLSGRLVALDLQFVRKERIALEEKMRGMNATNVKRKTDSTAGNNLITMKHLIGSFYILGGGCALALIIFLIEYFRGRLWKDKVSFVNHKVRVLQVKSV
ncbi:Glutamate receptor 1 [Folsomia candida]|uniref:Glutamate receptor 1 n=1 Tax=Folsomia candida TaxID=158441 RepID=A0A226EHY7_FOLCA|nr:Glutamate receptor 1 [Folsomia candida]